jgi:hypothetical protein
MGRVLGVSRSLSIHDYDCLELLFGHLWMLNVQACICRLVMSRSIDGRGVYLDI